MYRLPLLALFLVVSLVAAGQDSVQFTVIEEGLDEGDSSYYDIEQVGDDEFWAVGKYGIITSLNSEGEFHRVDFPHKGPDLLKIMRLDEDRVMVTADSGFYYTYDKSLDKWEETRLEDYKESCLYNATKIDDNTLFLCGGSSGIAAERRAIPFGFILRSRDGGKTWQKVFDKTWCMVWSIKYDRLASELQALTYNPLRRSKLIRADKKGDRWEKTGMVLKGLFHDFSTINKEVMFSGGRNGKFNFNGAIATVERINNFASGMFWDIQSNKEWILATSTGGNLAYRRKLGDWSFINTTVKKNLYEIFFVEQNIAYVVGSGKTILRVELP